MTEITKDKIHKAIEVIGIENAEKLYSIFGNEKVSFAGFHREILKTKAAVLSGKKSIAKIAKELKLSRMTVYRFLYKNKKSHKS